MASDQTTLNRPVSTIERRLNNTLRGFDALPLRIVPD
jgi:hypothetical protein